MKRFLPATSNSEEGPELRGRVSGEVVGLEVVVVVVVMGVWVVGITVDSMTNSSSG